MDKNKPSAPTYLLNILCCCSHLNKMDCIGLEEFTTIIYSFLFKSQEPTRIFLTDLNYFSQICFIYSCQSKASHVVFRAGASRLVECATFRWAVALARACRILNRKRPGSLEARLLRHPDYSHLVQTRCAPLLPLIPGLISVSALNPERTALWRSVSECVKFELGAWIRFIF